MGTLTLTVGASVIEVPVTVEGLWPGHQVGLTYVGMSLNNFYMPHGARRSFRAPAQWDNDSLEHDRVNDDHAAGRLPWVSFKPPGSWADISAGVHDASIRTKAQRYAAYTRPVLATFHHEPFDDGPAADWVAAFLHILNVMTDEVGSLGQTTYCPIYHGHNIADVGGDWLTDEIIARCPIIGIDHYQRAPEIEVAFDYLAGRGVRSVGVGETGRGAVGGARADTVAEFEVKLDMFRARAELVSVACFFNSNEQNFAADPYPNGAACQTLWDDYQTGGCRLPLS